MLPDRLSLPLLSNESQQPARPSGSVQDEHNAFSSLYAEALQSAEQTVAELGSVDSEGAETTDEDFGSGDMLSFLELRAACLPGGSTSSLEDVLAGELSGGDASEWAAGGLSPGAAGGFSSLRREFLSSPGGSSLSVGPAREVAG